MIKVIDNPLSNDFANELEEYYNSNKIPWRFVPDIALKQDNPTMSRTMYGFTNWSYDEGRVLNQDLYYLLNVLYACDKVSNIYQVRSFMHTPSIEPNIPNANHIDLEYPHKVCLYYVNDSDGDTIFFDNDQNEIARNTPKKNTAVLFDGSILHCSSTPSSFRHIINFDYI